MINTLYKYRELLGILTWRHLKVRYKQTFFGILWVIMYPVITMIIFTIIFSKFLKVPSDNVPYALFVYSAILPWTLFSKAMVQATQSLVGNVTLVTKIYFPREIMIYSVILANLVDFFIDAVYSDCCSRRNGCRGRGSAPGTDGSV